MASACINPSPPPPNLLDSPPSWFSPRISFSHDFVLTQDPSKSPRNGDLDFEFQLVDEICSGGNNKKNFSFSPADELFSDGKLIPLSTTSSHNNNTTTTTIECKITKDKHDDDDDQEKKNTTEEELKIFEEKIVFEKSEIMVNVSPKAPKCSWKEFLGLKRSQNPSFVLQRSSETSTKNPKSLKSLKFFSKSASNNSMNHPLLVKDKDLLDTEAIYSRRSMSSSSNSSSSGQEHEDINHSNPRRLSLDSEKTSLPKLKLVKPKLQKSSTARSSRVSGRVGRAAARRAAPPEAGSRGVSVDSPRMNSSGKIVFSSLERSSSSPSTFNGGPRLKARGMERSYSANVRIRPVLNVPICSLRGSSSGKSGSVFGFGQLFSSQKKDGVRQQSNIKRNGSGNNR